MAGQPMTSEDIVVTAGFAGMVLLDLVGNSIVCLLVLLNKRLQTPMNYLLCNLAISDMAVAVFVSPEFLFRRAFVHPQGALGVWMCRFVTGRRLFWVSAVASSLCLVAVAFERYFAVTQPLTANINMSKRKVYVIAGVCWLTAFVWLLPTFVLIKYNPSEGRCHWEFSLKVLTKTYQMGCIIIVGAIPFGVMLCLYSRVVHELWIQRKSAELGVRQRAIVRRRRRVSRVVITITAFYVLCWVPNLVQMWAELGFREHRISLLLVTLNSSVNPLLYTLQSEPFRKNLLNLFCCRKQAKGVPPSRTPATTQ